MQKTDTPMVKRASPAARSALGTVKLAGQKRAAATAYQRSTSSEASSASGLRLKIPASGRAKMNKAISTAMVKPYTSKISLLA